MSLRGCQRACAAQGYALFAIPNLFVAVGQNGQRVTSENGVDWINSLVGKEGETYRAVAFGGGRFVAVGSYGGTNIFGTTTDGVTWDASKFEGNYSRYVRGIVFHKGSFIALGGDPGTVGLAKPFALTSSDGKTGVSPDARVTHPVRRDA